MKKKRYQKNINLVYLDLKKLINLNLLIQENSILNNKGITRIGITSKDIFKIPK